MSLQLNGGCVPLMQTDVEICSVSNSGVIGSLRVVIHAGRPNALAQAQYSEKEGEYSGGTGGKLRLLIQFRTFRVQNCFFEVISYPFGIMFRLGNSRARSNHQKVPSGDRKQHFFVKMHWE